MVKFSEDVLGAVRESKERKLYNLEERLDLVRNHTYIPVSAPMGFRNAIAYGMELMDKQGEGPLVKGVSSGVLRMIVAIRNAIGGEVAERAPDRRPRVVFARVDSYDESSELIETLMDCMAVYIEKFGRGMGFRVNGCRFSDDPLLVLPEDAMRMVNEIIDRGSFATTAIRAWASILSERRLSTSGSFGGGRLQGARGDEAKGDLRAWPLLWVLRRVWGGGLSDGGRQWEILQPQLVASLRVQVRGLLNEIQDFHMARGRLARRAARAGRAVGIDRLGGGFA